MIIRILGEGQFDFPDDALDGLNVLDTRLEIAIALHDDAAFGIVLRRLLREVHALGTPVPEEEIVPSDLVLPPEDAGLDEVSMFLADDGLVPG
jgi:hypothetical protein